MEKDLNKLEKKELEKKLIEINNILKQKITIEDDYNKIENQKNEITKKLKKLEQELLDAESLEKQKLKSAETYMTEKEYLNKKITKNTKLSNINKKQTTYLLLVINLIIYNIIFYIVFKTITPFFFSINLIFVLIDLPIAWFYLKEFKKGIILSIISFFLLKISEIDYQAVLIIITLIIISAILLIIFVFIIKLLKIKSNKNNQKREELQRQKEINVLKEKYKIEKDNFLKDTDERKKQIIERYELIKTEISKNIDSTNIELKYI